MLELNEGGSVILQRLDGDRFVIVSPRPAAPGTPLSLRFEGAAVVFKVQRSVKGDDGRFTIEGRVVNLTRELRQRLLALL